MRRAMVALLGVSGLVWQTAHAAAPAVPTPARLSFVDGEVSFRRPGAQEWARARANIPLARGDALYTGKGANSGMQVGPRASVRAGESTELELSDIEPDFLQHKPTAGETSLAGGGASISARASHKEARACSP